MNDPLAILYLDSRAHGPAHCAACDEEIEVVYLTSGSEFVCPTCGAPVPWFGEVSELFCSARALTADEIATFKKTEKPS